MSHQELEYLCDHYNPIQRSDCNGVDIYIHCGLATGTLPLILSFVPVANRNVYCRLATGTLPLRFMHVLYGIFPMVILT